MIPDHLFNVESAAIVGGGTLLATLLRCGWRDCRQTLLTLLRLWRRPFAAEQARAELAGQVNDIKRDGLLRARPRRSGDAEFDDATDAMIARRSVSAMLERHEAHKARRAAASNAAIRTLIQAAELGPVLGLVGTLVSLSQLPAEGLARGALTGAISMAVLTTLYGLTIANFVFAPLARLVERRAIDEELEREAVTDWLAREVEPLVPGHGAPEHHRTAHGPAHGLAA